MNNHNMILEMSYPTGAEKWLCPICDRKFILSLEPYKRIILVEGNQNTDHSFGATGELKINIGEFRTRVKGPCIAPN